MSELMMQLHEAVPVSGGTLRLDAEGRKTGLIIVDEVNGFASVGYGNLAPPVTNPQVTRMVDETVRLARYFADHDWPILAFLDTHEPGKPEPPYPPHCERGTGEEELVDELKWLEEEPNATLIRKDCINGFVGAIGADGRNGVVEWANGAGIEDILVVGICTDICVMDFVLTALSARNHGMMPTCERILVYEKGCATYDLPREAATGLGLPETASHPQQLTHHMGLYFMASRGAELVETVSLES